MRKLIVAEHISLDNVMQAPGGPEEDPSEGFRLGGWTVPYFDDAIGQQVQDQSQKMIDADVKKYGYYQQLPYQMLAQYWGRCSPAPPGPRLISTIRRRTCSRTPRRR